ATQLQPPRLSKSFSMPVDPAVFAGIPSVTALKPLPQANVLLAAAMDRRVICCDLAAPPKDAAKDKTLCQAKHLNWSHDHWIHDLDVRPDGVYSATGGTDRHIKLWKWGQEEPVTAFKAHDDCVRVVAFSPDGKILASAGDDCRVRLWDMTTAKPLATLD